MAMYLAAHTTAAACVATAIASLVSVKLSALQDTIQALVSIVTAARWVLWCLYSEETHCLQLIGIQEQVAMQKKQA